MRARSLPARVSIWRRIEIKLSYILRGWPRTPERVGPMGFPYRGGHTAFCDGLMIGSGPWLCYCCLLLREKIMGVRFKTALRPFFMHAPAPMGLSYRVVNCHSVDGCRRMWVWPCVKNVYPAVMNDGSGRRFHIVGTLGENMDKLK